MSSLVDEMERSCTASPYHVAVWWGPTSADPQTKRIFFFPIYWDLPDPLH